MTDEEIQGVDAYVAVAAPESIAPGTALTLMGFGCAQAGAVSDNQLRIGDSAIARFVYHALQTNGHAILCPGDSGGPAFADIDGRKRLAGINSQTNYSSSWHTRVDSMESQQFLRSIAEEYEIDICGINSDCL